MAMLAILGACGAHDGQLATEPSGSEALHFNLVPGETKTWSRDTTISGTFSVPVGSKLIIAPGVDVAFSQGGELVVRGTIEGANATLTAANPLCPKACWKGVRVLGPLASIDFDHMKILRAIEPIVVNGDGGFDGMQGDNSSRNGPEQVKRIVNSVLKFAGDSMAFIRVVNADKVELSRDSLGAVTGGSIDGSHGIQFTRVRKSRISGNVIGPVHKDGITLSGIQFEGSTQDTVSGNTVINSYFQCYYVSTYSTQNLFTDNKGVDCGGALSVWTAWANTFSRFHFTNVRSTGLNLCNVLNDATGQMAVNTFDHLYFDGWSSNALLVVPADCGTGYVFPPSGQHNFRLTYGVFRRNGISIIFNPTGADYKFFGLGTGEGTMFGDLPFIAGDLDNDGRADMVTPRLGPNGVAPFFNRGTDTLERTGHAWELPQAPLANLRFADFNGDGKLDVLAFTGTTGLVQVAASGGTGGFTNLGLWEVPWVATGNLRFADFTGDGRTDVLGFSGTHTAQVAASGGTGGFANLGFWELPWTSNSNMRFANFTGSPAVDVLAYVGGNQAQVALSGGTGGFANVGTWTLPSSDFSKMRFGYQNSDAYADVYVNQTSSISVYLNQGGTGFASSPSVTYQTTPSP